MFDGGVDRFLGGSAVFSFWWAQRFTWGVCLLVASLAAPVLGHDLWLVPGRFRMTPGESIRIFINNGDQFPESLTLLGKQRVRRLEWASIDGKVRVVETAVDGKSLSFDLQAPSSGHAVLSLETEPRTIRLTAEDFRSYLESEQQESLIDRIASAEEARGALIERYQKYAKALLLGRMPVAREDDLWRRAVGHRLEIVPESMPGEFVSGERLRFKVLFGGEPIAGVRLVAGRSDEQPFELGTTSIDGTVGMSLEHPGRWFVRAFIIQPMPDESLDADYESFWATLTFEIGPRPLE